MGWLSRVLRGDEQENAQTPPASPAVTQGDRDDVPHLKVAVADLVGEINASAGRLPSVGVVLSRRITDALSDVVSFGEQADLGIDARVAVYSIATDYLPTTLRSYVRAERAGKADAGDELHRQLLGLAEASQRLLGAVQSRDAQAQQVQGIFLEDKYRGEGGGL